MMKVTALLPFLLLDYQTCTSFQIPVGVTRRHKYNRQYNPKYLLPGDIEPDVLHNINVDGLASQLAPAAFGVVMLAAIGVVFRQMKQDEQPPTVVSADEPILNEAELIRKVSPSEDIMDKDKMEEMAALFLEATEIVVEQVLLPIVEEEKPNAIIKHSPESSDLEATMEGSVDVVSYAEEERKDLILALEQKSVEADVEKEESFPDPKFGDISNDDDDKKELSPLAELTTEDESGSKNMPVVAESLGEFFNNEQISEPDIVTIDLDQLIPNAPIIAPEEQPAGWYAQGSYLATLSMVTASEPIARPATMSDEVYVTSLETDKARKAIQKQAIQKTKDRLDHKHSTDPTCSEPYDAPLELNSGKMVSELEPTTTEMKSFLAPPCADPESDIVVLGTPRAFIAPPGKVEDEPEIAVTRTFLPPPPLAGELEGVNSTDTMVKGTEEAKGLKFFLRNRSILVAAVVLVAAQRIVVTILKRGML